MKLLQMNEPFYTFNDSINYYSVIHFIEYIILSLIPFVKFVHVAILSVSWEILELFYRKGVGKKKVVVINFSILFLIFQVLFSERRY